MKGLFEVVVFDGVNGWLLLVFLFIVRLIEILVEFDERGVIDLLVWSVGGLIGDDVVGDFLFFLFK